MVIVKTDHFHHREMPLNFTVTFLLIKALCCKNEMKPSSAGAVALKTVLIGKTVLGGHSLSDSTTKKVCEKSVFETERLDAKGWGRD